MVVNWMILAVVIATMCRKLLKSYCVVSTTRDKVSDLVHHLLLLFVLQSLFYDLMSFNWWTTSSTWYNLLLLFLVHSVDLFAICLK